MHRSQASRAFATTARRRCLCDALSIAVGEGAEAEAEDLVADVCHSQ
jgi:hypothetical protein